MYFFWKKVHAVYNGVWGKASEAGEFWRIFVLKVTLQFVKLVAEKMVEQNVPVTPPIILLPLLLRFPRPWLSVYIVSIYRMDYIRKYDIELEKEQYYAGETLRGWVVIENAENLRITGTYITFTTDIVLS